MKHFKFSILTILVLSVLNSCKDKVEQKEEVLRPVKYQVVGTSDAQKIRSFSGVAKAGDEIELSFRSNGIITDLNVTVGQKVKKGDLIAKLDNVQANLAYEQSVSALNSANSAMKTAKSALDRAKSLYENGSRSLSEYESARNDYQSALDQYESAKRNRSIQSSQVNYGYIYAPKDGTIATRPATLNANVSAGQVVAILNAGQQINIMVGLPENVINKVQTGMEVEIALSALENKFKGNILEVAPVVDVNSSTYPVKVDIVTPTTAVKPGMAASVTFNFGTGGSSNDNTLVVPVKAVGEDGGGNFVLIVESSDEKTGTVKRRSIELGDLTSEGFRIISGLQGGEKIVTAGLQTLLDGQKVGLE